LIPILPPENQPQQPPQPPPGQPEEIRAWLGIFMQDTTPQTDPAGPQSPGTVITILNVFPGSPAERAQMKEGDVLITMDGERLSNVQDLQRRLEEYRPGMKPRFLLMRNGTFLETVVTLEEITQSMMEALQPPPGQPTQPGAPGGQPPTGQPPSGGPQQGGQQAGSQVPPLIQEARQLSAQGQFLQASEKYDEHLRQYPNDGRAAAEQAEMVFFNIQNARGMALMAQAVKKQGLSVPEKTRLRMVIASRRFESGNLITAKQMLIEALRDDPTNPDVNRLLDVIYQIEAAARAQQAPVGPGHPKTDLEIHLEHEFSEALEDLFD
jgi:tetratricopeptide (TPR) repeat protein